MAGAVIFKPLFTGILPAGLTVLYECPAGTRAIARMVRMVNRSANDVPVQLFANWNGMDLEQFPMSYKCGANQQCQDLHLDIFLDEADTISVNADTANVLACYLGGIEQSKS